MIPYPDFQSEAHLCANPPALAGGSLVPFECIGFPAISDFYNVSTVGLASGNSKAEAILHSIYEVIEHDTLNTTLYSGFPYQQIQLIPEDGQLYKIKNIIERSGITIRLIRLINNYRVPTVLALFYNIPGMEGINVAGMGSSLDIRAAIMRAITEAEQSACYWNEKYDNNDMEEKQEFHPSLVFGESNYEVTKKIIISQDMGMCTHFNSKEEELEKLIRHLQSSANQIVVVDITNPRLGYSTVKTIIPNFEDCIEDIFVKQRSITIKKVMGEYIKNGK